MLRLKDINWDNSAPAECIDNESIDEYYGVTTCELTVDNMIDLTLGETLYIVIEGEYALLIKYKENEDHGHDH